MEPQECKSRIILFLAFISTLVAIGLLAAAMGSDDWVTASTLYISSSNEVLGTAQHGLFKGRLTNPGGFARTYDTIITCTASSRVCRYDAIDPASGTDILVSNGNYDEQVDLTTICTLNSNATGILKRPGELNFWSWISTVIFLSLAMAFALIAAVFTMFNVVYVPISDIVGVHGVYVWNGAACLCTLVTLCVWAGLHFAHLRYNILPGYVLSNMKVTSCGTARHGVAVWLCLAALLLFVLNIVVIRFRRGSPIKKRSTVHGHGKTKYVKGEETLY